MCFRSLPVADPSTAAVSADASDAATTILFQQPLNATQTSKIFWVGLEGELVVYNELKGAGAEYEQPTFQGHVWVVFSGQRELGRYIATEKYSVVQVPEIDEDDDVVEDDTVPKCPKCPCDHGMS